MGDFTRFVNVAKHWIGITRVLFVKFADAEGNKCVSSDLREGIFILLNCNKGLMENITIKAKSSVGWQFALLYKDFSLKWDLD